MPVYPVHDQGALVALAAQRGWLEGGRLPRTAVHTLPPVQVTDASLKTYELAPAQVETRESATVRLPEAVVHGGNLSLIVEDRVFHGGLAHSYGPSAAFKPLAGGSIRYEPRPVRSIAGAELLGIVCHWGHFFVDALDRLLAREAAGAQGPCWLVSDPDLFGLKPSVDACLAVPQVSDLIRAMGIAWRPSLLAPVAKGEDVVVTGLRVRSLCSAKPSMSGASLVEARRRVGIGDEPLSKGGGTLVFVGRKAVHRRFVRHQDQVAEQLRALAGARTVYPEHMTRHDAAACFGAAGRVILPVGSAKFNLAFCRPGTRVICVNPRGYSTQPGGVPTMVRHMCHALGLCLAFYEVEIERAKMLLHSNLVFTEADGPALLRLFEHMEAP